MITLITLLIWNIHAIPLIGSDPNAVLKRLNSMNPDYILLQEQFRPFLHKELSFRYNASHQITNGFPVKYSGLWFGSKLGNADITGVDNIVFKDRSWSRGDFLLRKGAQIYNHPSFRIINIHLDSGRDRGSAWARYLQLTQLINSIPKDDKPLIIAGDLNLSSNKYIDQTALKVYSLFLKLKVGFSNGFDYVLVNDKVNIIETKVLGWRESDHKPILIKVEINND